MAERGRPNFSGKVLLLYTRGFPVEHATPIAFERWEEIGDRLVMIGRELDMTRRNWLAGLEVTIAWESVDRFYVFESEHEYRARATKGR